MLTGPICLSHEIRPPKSQLKEGSEPLRAEPGRVLSLRALGCAKEAGRLVSGSR